MLIPTSDSGALSSIGSYVRVRLKYLGEVFRSDSCQNIKEKPMSIVSGTIHHFLITTSLIVAKSKDICFGGVKTFTLSKAISDEV